MKKTVILSLLLTTLVWLIFSWPLPLHVTTAIPTGAAKPPQSLALQPMVPGDNLQLEYHFWLFGDMLAGRTPWFYNLYEFNTGTDSERYEPGSYYFPFSLFHTVGTWIAGRAFGWNLSCFLSLWFAAFFTYRLVRRYTDSDPGAWLGAAAAIMMPYRWANLMGGSPTGFALMWVPILFLGLDIAVREDRFRGGLLAGAAILGTAWGDAHTFFFIVLATPCWCIVAFLQRERFDWKNPKAFVRLAVAMAPIVVFAALAYLSSKTTTKQIGEAKGGGARSWSEVALFSPSAAGFFTWEDLGVSNHIYFGCTLAVTLLAGIFLGLRRRRLTWAWALVLVGLVGAGILALGTNGPWHGRALAVARKLIPPYAVLRQPAKIYCLVPTLAAVALGLSVSCFAVPRKAAWVLAAVLLFDMRMQVQPIVCRWETTQEAYAAVAREGRADRPAKALVIPLWPGDSHYGSIYQHFASLYHVRMINGYRPLVARDYIEDIFRGFKSVNMGVLSISQIDDLQKRGTDFILLHEDLYPEKVSPFPVAFTLKNLLSNPRLELIKQDRSVWAFRIVARRKIEEPPVADWTTFFPARHINWADERQRTAPRHEDKNASAGAYITLASTNDLATAKRTEAVWTDNLRWMLRLRGTGTVAVVCRGVENRIDVQAPDWTWFETPIDRYDDAQQIPVTLKAIDGSVDADVALLVAGPWSHLKPGEELSLPAAEFFHAGHAVLEDGSVELRAGVDRQGIVMYGPRMPFAPGDYDILIEMKTRAAVGTELGKWIAAYASCGDFDEFAAVAGTPVVGRLVVRKNLPLQLVYVSHDIADCEIVRIVFKRLRDVGPLPHAP